MSIFYCVCDDDCRYETMTKEQILTAIEEALEQGHVSDPDGAVFSKIKETRANEAVQIWVGTEAEYNAISPAHTVEKSVVRVGADGVLYLCSDDTSLSDLENHIDNTTNPHNVTAEQVGAAKKSAFENHANNTSNPHKVTAAQTGALPTTGGTVTGDLTVGDAGANSQRKLILSRTINSASATTIQMWVNYDGTAVIALYSGAMEVNRFTLGKTFTKFNQPASVESGGTGATTRADAFENLACLEIRPVESVEDDTPAKWAEIGSGYAYYNVAGSLTDQPSKHGILVNYAYIADVVQIWHSQLGGAMYIRGGNASGWLGTWRKLFDDQMVIPTANLNIIYSETEPEYAEGRIWLKPV